MLGHKNTVEEAKHYETFLNQFLPENIIPNNLEVLMLRKTVHLF